MALKELPQRQKIPTHLPRHESTTPREERSYKLKHAFEKLAEYPPGGDIIYTRPAFYAAASLPQLIQIALDCQDERRDVSPVAYPYLAQLFAMHALNYAMIFDEGRPDYVRENDLRTVSAWQKFYSQALVKHDELLRHLTVTRDIQTTRPNRGVTLPFILNRVFPGKPLVIDDLGCSTLSMWKHLRRGGKFKVNKDKTFSTIIGPKVFENNPSQTVNIEHVTGIDLVNPLADPALFDWLLANGHFDEVTPEKIEIKKQELLSDQNGFNNIVFQQGDIYSPEAIPHGVDVTTVFGVLSQKPSAVANLGLDIARGLLNESGLLVFQDYARHDGDKFVFPDDREFYLYGTWVTGPALGPDYENEFLHIASARVTNYQDIRGGKDLDLFISLTQTQ